ncbi:MAG: hypothetical protein U1B30_16005 [Pseudomonadota bacterium]|nr:hypothetical protein [Pseudomonadota bacterium]
MATYYKIRLKNTASIDEVVKMHAKALTEGYGLSGKVNPSSYLEALDEVVNNSKDCRLTETVEALVLLGAAQADLWADIEYAHLGAIYLPEEARPQTHFASLVQRGENLIIDALKSCWR